MIQVDARGLSCPDPVIRTKRAIEENAKEITVMVDNNVAKENVTRALESQGYRVNIKETDEDIFVHGKK